MVAPHIIGATAVACYSYMALVPIIQPPIIKLLTSKKERAIYMKPQLRAVSKLEKLLFPIISTIFIILIVPLSAPLIGMFMLGNLFTECGVTDRLSNTSSTAMIDILTIFLPLAIGSTMTAENFLHIRTLTILLLGIVSFATATAGGVIMAKIKQFRQRTQQVKDRMDLILKIDQNRFIWPRILDEISGALPTYTWLESVSETSPFPQLMIRLEGTTMSNLYLSRFLNNLEHTSMLADVKLISSVERIHESYSTQYFIIGCVCELNEPFDTTGAAAGQ